MTPTFTLISRLMLGWLLLAIPAGAFAQTLHVLTFCDTDDSSIGTAAAVGAKFIQSELAGRVAYATGMAVRNYTLHGSSFTLAQVKSQLSSLSCGSNDAILVWIEAHGYNNGSNDWPMISCKGFERPQDRSIPLQDIYTTLMAKGARLTVVVGNACNTPVPTRQQANSEPYAAHHGTDGDDNYALLKELFLYSKGSAMLAGCKKGEKSYSNTAAGSYLYLKFKEAFNKQVVSSSATWESLFGETITLVGDYATGRGYDQHPIRYVSVVVEEGQPAAPAQPVTQQAPQAAKPVQTLPWQTTSSQPAQTTTPQQVQPAASASKGQGYYDYEGIYDTRPAKKTAPTTGATAAKSAPSPQQSSPDQAKPVLEKVKRWVNTQSANDYDFDEIEIRSQNRASTQQNTVQSPRQEAAAQPSPRSSSLSNAATPSGQRTSPATQPQTQTETPRSGSPSTSPRTNVAPQPQPSPRYETPRSGAPSTSPRANVAPQPQQSPRYETPRSESPRYETNRSATPTQQQPQYESPRAQSPRYETPAPTRVPVQQPRQQQSPRQPQPATIYIQPQPNANQGGYQQPPTPIYNQPQPNGNRGGYQQPPTPIYNQPQPNGNRGGYQPQPAPQRQSAPATRSGTTTGGRTYGPRTR